MIVLFGLAIPEQAVIIGRHQMFSAIVDAQHLYRAGAAGPCDALRRVPDDAVFPRHPGEIDEAALLDNASRFHIFWRILLPLTIPAQATLGIFTFFHAWNDYWWPLISATNKRHAHAHGRALRPRR